MSINLYFFGFFVTLQDLRKVVIARSKFCEDLAMLSIVIFWGVFFWNLDKRKH